MARRQSATPDRAHSACNARQRINQTSARLASLRNALQAVSIEGAWVISSSKRNSSTLSATTSRGRAGNSVTPVVGRDRIGGNKRSPWGRVRQFSSVSHCDPRVDLDQVHADAALPHPSANVHRRPIPARRQPPLHFRLRMMADGALRRKMRPVGSFGLYHGRTPISAVSNALSSSNVWRFSRKT